MTPFVADPDFELYVGDVRDVLPRLPDESVDCCVTSPPYWGLRDYGTDGQMGLEATSEEYVAAMVAVFREVRRVLAPHGTVWLNLGDSYNSGAQFNGHKRKDGSGDAARPGQYAEGGEGDWPGHRPLVPDLKVKDLVGVPWRVAFALQADGWYLRSDIVWSKPNPMPESVTDRPTKSHEYVFLLAKQPRYFFDQEAVREPASASVIQRGARGYVVASGANGGGKWPAERKDAGRDRVRSYAEYAGGRNVRSVWEISTQCFPDAHFATYPEELVRRCIAAGCPESVCGTCGKPRERIVQVESSWRSRAENGAIRGNLAPEGLVGAGTQRAVHGAGVSHDLDSRQREILGWSDCGHGNYRPGVVLDPFMGSGTTALVARRLGRRSIGVELNESYAEMAARRLQQLSLLAEGAA